MKSTSRETVPPEKLLSALAMQFRGTRDETARQRIAASYALAVKQLKDSGKWREIPPLEDQLPDDWMPKDFFDYWSLGPPKQRARRQA